MCDKWPYVTTLRVRSYSEYLDAINSDEPIRRIRENNDLSIINGTDGSFVSGFCCICNKLSQFAFDGGANGSINWRETFRCSCGLNSRLRASYHALSAELQISQNSFIYITEQTTPFYELLRSNYHNLVGSEYLSDGTKLGSYNQFGLRSEDVTNLTFSNLQFDLVICLDVLEHVPRYEEALSEFYRVLKPNGMALFTFPFHFNSPSTVVRSLVNDDGSITHLCPPEYHGDPLSNDGVLCFQDIGWDIFCAFKALGYRDAYLIFYHAPEYGYFGNDCSLLVAIK